MTNPQPPSTGPERRERPEGGVCALVVEQRGIAGFCRIDPRGDVASLSVPPDRRRGGVGAALLVEL
jgi:hypothetical protein